MHRPQEDNVRPTVDHRQYAIDPTMWAERPTLWGVDRLGYPGMYRAKIIALPTHLFRRNALPNLVRIYRGCWLRGNLPIPGFSGDSNFLSAAGEEQRRQRDHRRRKCKTAEEGTPDQSAILLGNLRLSERHARSNCDHGNRDGDKRCQAYDEGILIFALPKPEATADPSKYAQDRRAHKPSRSFIRQSGGERRNQCKEDQRSFPYREIKIGLNNYGPPAQC
jgi:hypothetical protein